MSTNNILKLIANMDEQMATLKRNVREQGKQGLADVAKDVFNEVEGLKKFVVIGYTPSFNDGEPCEHSSIYGFGNYRWHPSHRNDGTYWLSGDDVGEREELAEFFELENLMYYDSTSSPEDSPVVYVNSGVKSSEKAYNLIGAMDDLCEMLYDTNYIIYFTLNEDGSVNVEQDDYDCGW